MCLDMVRGQNPNGQNPNRPKPKTDKAPTTDFRCGCPDFLDVYMHAWFGVHHCPYDFYGSLRICRRGLGTALGGIEQ